MTTYHEMHRRAFAADRGQSRVGSAVETAANIAIGYVVAIGAQSLIFPAFGIRIAFGDNLLIGMFFTVVSLIRSYALRRLFNSGRLHDISLAAHRILWGAL